jgi:hypothetical protein
MQAQIFNLRTHARERARAHTHTHTAPEMGGNGSMEGAGGCVATAGAVRGVPRTPGRALCAPASLSPWGRGRLGEYDSPFHPCGVLAFLVHSIVPFAVLLVSLYCHSAETRFQTCNLYHTHTTHTHTLHTHINTHTHTVMHACMPLHICMHASAHNTCIVGQPLNCAARTLHTYLSEHTLSLSLSYLDLEKLFRILQMGYYQLLTQNI